MSKVILFSLEHCVKCNQTKELLLDRDDIEIITLPHDITEWTEEHLDLVKTYQVFDELQQTAPILWLNGEKMVGYLRIRKWLQDNKS
jgi:glutaredoxin